MRIDSTYNSGSTRGCSLIVLLLFSVFLNVDVSARTLTDSELAFLPANQLAKMIKNGDLTSERITRIYLQRIKKFNPKLNAIATLDKAGALARAKQADAALAKGIIWGALHGVPITIKDNYNVKGMRSTAGYLPLKDNIPDTDAPIVERLRNAGAVILGKTNMPPMGLDAQTYNPIFGVTNNPWDLSRTPGGSSGGCASAVAAGLTALSIGNDIGGSIRIPTHFSGVYGIKTTEHSIPGTGMVKEEGSERTIRHLITHGPITRSVEDLSMVLGIIAGDGADYEVPRVVTVPSDRNAKNIDDIKVAWMDTAEGVFIDADTQHSFSEFVYRLNSQGVSTQKAQPQGFYFDAVQQVFFDLLEAQVIAPTLSWFERTLLCHLGEGCLVTEFTDYFNILSSRDAIALEIDKLLETYDVWVLPVASTSAHKHRITNNYDGPLPIYDEPLFIDGQPYTVYTEIFNLTGHPVVTIPIGYNSDGLPIGIQIVGKRWYDADLLAIAKQLNDIAGNYRQPPGFK